MFQLVYASAALSPFGPFDLRELLVAARSRNSTQRVTGMLLHHTGSFVQVLEGPEVSVERIFASIQRDPRHHRIEVLLRGPVAQREFDDWTMGFLDISEWPRINGMVDYEHHVPELISAPTAAKRYLRFFQQGLCRQAAFA